MSFWGTSLKPNSVTPYVPSADVEEDKVHISQACLAPDAKPGSKATVLLQVGDSTPLAICTLREGSTDCMNLDLILDHYSEFTVKGNAPVHLTGYYMPEYEIDGEEEEDDDDDPYGIQGMDDDGDLELDSDDEELPGMAGRLLGFDENGQPVFDQGYEPAVVVDDDYESDEDSDYETEDSEEDDEIDSEEEEEVLKQRGVVIEDITESEEANGSKKAKATPAPKSNGKVAAFNDDDVDSSDSEEEEDDDESDSEEEEDVKAKGTAAKKQQVGDKRKAAEAPQPAKQPKTAEKKTPATKTKPTPASKNEPKEEPTPGSMGKDKVRRWPNGFEIQVQKMGSADGKLAKIGKKVIVKYVGTLKNGKVFDQNNKFAFRLGVGEVIKGWDRGVEGMRVGDKRKLIVPPAMGYGSSKVGPIPSNSELHFEVELIDVKG